MQLLNSHFVICTSAMCEKDYLINTRADKHDIHNKSNCIFKKVINLRYFLIYLRYTHAILYMG